MALPSGRPPVSRHRSGPSPTSQRRKKERTGGRWPGLPSKRGDSPKVVPLSQAAPPVDPRPQVGGDHEGTAPIDVSCGPGPAGRPPSGLPRLLHGAGMGGRAKGIQGVPHDLRLRAGLRPSRLQTAMIPAWQTELARQLAQVGNLVLKGSIAEDIRASLCGARFGALPITSGVAPTAVGGTPSHIGL